MQTMSLELFFRFLFVLSFVANSALSWNIAQPLNLSLRSFVRGANWFDHSDHSEKKKVPATYPKAQERKMTNYRLEGSSFGEEKKEEVTSVLVTPKMIVFDKDGTLGDDTASLRRWVDFMTNNLRQELQLLGKHSDCVDRDVQCFHNAIGWDALAETVVPSAPLAAGTWEEQIVTSSGLLEGMGINDSRQKVTQWHADLGNLHGCDAPIIENLPGLMRECKARGLKIAICTSDDRPSTDSSILNWNLKDLIDHSICGNEVKNGKPSAEPLQILCKQANVDAAACIVVGDTTSDTGMATNAGAGLCIGVLSGSGSSEQLRYTGANIVLPNVGLIPQVLDAIGLVKEPASVRCAEEESDLAFNSTFIRANVIR